METLQGQQPTAAVLIVEDHLDSRQMYAEFLKATFTVLEADDGVGALDILETTTPDIVVTDLALPRLDGFELIERIRGDTRLAQVPIIALSGYSSAEHSQRALAAGANLILTKPCLPETLADAVATATTGRKG